MGVAKNSNNATETGTSMSTDLPVGPNLDNDEELMDGCIHIDAERDACWLDAIVSDDVSAAQQILQNASR